MLVAGGNRRIQCDVAGGAVDLERRAGISARIGVPVDGEIRASVAATLSGTIP